jgi:hypothetical protein
MPDALFRLKAEPERRFGYATAERMSDPLAGAERMSDPLVGWVVMWRMLAYAGKL